MDHDSGTRTRWPWFAPAAGIVLVLTILGSFQPLGSTVVRAAGGLALGLVMVAVAAWINRRDGRRRFVADGTLLLGALATGGLFGTGFIFLPLLNDLLAMSPQTLPMLLQPPIGIDLSIYYFVANPLMELVVIPLALLTNWHIPRRRALLIVAAVIFYGMRFWTYLYFAPIFVGLAGLPSGQPFSPAVLEQIAQFTNLSWIRLCVEAVTCVGLLLALRISVPRDKASSAPARGVNAAALRSTSSTGSPDGLRGG